MSNYLKLTMREQSLEHDVNGYLGWTVADYDVSVSSKETALVLCDVWDHHWCRGAEERLEKLLPRINTVIKAAREKGILIVHAPSETMAFYAKSPARQRVLTVPPVQIPEDLLHDTPPLPVDASDGGCDTDGNAATVDEKVWTRQHPAIEIDHDQDVISDNGRELYRLYVQRSIKNVIILGVHTNMCILNRSFAIKQMVRWGFNVMLVRDLTDSMYNPAQSPYVNHNKGTQLVIEYIEKFWCPTISSENLLNTCKG